MNFISWLLLGVILLAFLIVLARLIMRSGEGCSGQTCHNCHHSCCSNRMNNTIKPQK